MRPEKGHSYALLLMGFFLISTTSVYAQGIKVSGQVLAESGEPLPGVSVVEKGTSNGTSTDFDGYYEINVSGENSVLVFSYIGFAEASRTVGQNKTINLSLAESISNLDEVVVINYGYSTVNKKDMTGSVASISSTELSRIPVASAAEAISGRLAGVNVTTADGEPGADIRIRVRGGGSVTQDNSPLYVVDGFITAGINNIPPNDIESINVLKDAAATAIYGAQAANGVIVITTKNAREGKVSVSYDHYAQFNFLPYDRKYDVLSPYEYVLANYEIARLRSDADVRNFSRFFGAYDDLELYKGRKGTDWQDELFGGSRISYYHNIAVSGGTDMTKIRLSLSNNKDQGLLEGSGYKRNTANFKLNQVIIKNKLDIDLQARLTNTVIDGAGTSGNSQIKIKDAVQTRPVNGIADELDIDLTQLGSGSDNDYEQFLRSLIDPNELIKQDWRKRTEYDYVFNLALNWSIVNNLNFKTAFTSSKRFYENLRFYGPLTGESFNNGSSLPLGQREEITTDGYRWINTLNYKVSLGDDHRFDLLLGHETSSNSGNTNFLRAEEFRESITPEELFANMQLGRIDRVFTFEAIETNRLSFFGRLDYQFLDRYILTATVRADQSSKFSEKYNLGIFPALALAWQIDEEPFLENSNFVRDLKLRLSYGQTGNDRIPDDASRLLFETTTLRGPGFNNVDNVYYTPSSSTLYNPSLKWETTIVRNAGLDFGLIGGRLNGAIDVYYNTTEDLLLKSNIPSNTGFTTQWNNIGSTSNKGAELVLNSYFIDNKDFSLSANFNIGHNRAKIEELDGTSFRFERSNWASTDLNNINDYYLEVGGTVGDIYGYVTDGFYSTEDFASYDETSNEYILNDGVPNSSSVVGNTNLRPGFLKLKDLNTDGEVNADDRQVIGNALPDFQGGFGLNARWKGFDASIFFNYQVGNDVYNTGKIQFNQFRRVTYGNLLETMNSENRFTYIDIDGSYTGTPGGVVTDLDQLAQLNQGKNIWSHASHGGAGAVVHSWAIEDGSFLRLNNLTFGYSLPKDAISSAGISNLRIYVTGRNLHIWTKYSGFDPEVNSNNNPLTPGIDNSSFPRSRSYTVGLNITF